jgi:hypothetical protein
MSLSWHFAWTEDRIASFQAKTQVVHCDICMLWGRLNKWQFPSFGLHLAPNWPPFHVTEWGCPWEPFGSLNNQIYINYQGKHWYLVKWYSCYKKNLDAIVLMGWNACQQATKCHGDVSIWDTPQKCHFTLGFYMLFFWLWVSLMYYLLILIDHWEFKFQFFSFCAVAHHNDSIMHDAMPPQTSFSICCHALSTQNVWFGWQGLQASFPSFCTTKEMM